MQGCSRLRFHLKQSAAVSYATAVPAPRTAPRHSGHLAGTLRYDAPRRIVGTAFHPGPSLFRSACPPEHAGTARSLQDAAK